MSNDYFGDEFETDSALGGEVEFEEADDYDAEMERLVGRVQAARDAGV